MERVYFKVHDRLIRATCKLLSPRVRKFNEGALLALATLSLLTLAWLHSSYINLDMSANNCLKSLILEQAKAGGVDYRAVDLIKFTIDPVDMRQQDVPADVVRSKESQHYNYNYNCHNPLWTKLYYLDDYYLRKSETFQSYFVKNSVFERPITYYYVQDKSYFNYISDTYEPSSSSILLLLSPSAKSSTLSSPSSPIEASSLKVNNHTANSSIKTLEVSLSRDSSCFGPFALTLLLRSFVTYDACIVNWIGSLMGAKGYLLNSKTREEFDLSFLRQFIETLATEAGEEEFPTCESNRSILSLFSWKNFEYIIKKSVSKLAFKVIILASSLFLYFASSTVVSFTLRETQSRMLHFSHQLEHHVSHNIPINSIVFTHIVETLVFVPIMVGFMFFLFQFFYDKLLAFMIHSLVWIVEVYGVICVRSKLSIMYFPRFTLCYFTICHLYVLAYPYGHTYFAVFVLMLFLFHTMMYFYNNSEIPSFMDGTICEQTPRMALDGSSLAPSIVDQANDGHNDNNADGSGNINYGNNININSNSSSNSSNNSNNNNTNNSNSDNSSGNISTNSAQGTSSTRPRSISDEPKGRSDDLKPLQHRIAPRRHSDASHSDLGSDLILSMASAASQSEFNGAFINTESPGNYSSFVGKANPRKSLNNSSYKSKSGGVDDDYHNGMYNIFGYNVPNTQPASSVNINTPAVSPAKRFSSSAQEGYEALSQRPDVVSSRGNPRDLNRLVELMMSEKKKRESSATARENHSHLLNGYITANSSANSNNRNNKSGNNSDNDDCIVDSRNPISYISQSVDTRVDISGERIVVTNNKERGYSEDFDEAIEI